MTAIEARTRQCSNLLFNHQELPNDCCESLSLFLAKSEQLLEDFPRYPITPYCLAQISNHLEKKVSILAHKLSLLVYKKSYQRYSSFQEICLKSQEMVIKEVERKGNQQLVDDFCGLIFYNANERLTQSKMEMPLLRHCLKAVNSFAQWGSPWAIVGKRQEFENSLPCLFLPIYSLGACDFEFERFKGKEVLIAEFLYLEKDRYSSKFLVAPLEERFFLSEEVGQQEAMSFR